MRPDPARHDGGGQSPQDRRPEDRRREGNQRPESGSRGCVTFFGIALILIGVFFLVSRFTGASFSGGPSGITQSTTRREALPPGAVKETEYFADTLGWIGNETQLTAGMKHFYKKTGVQPYLYITDTVDGSHYPSQADLEVFANDLYDQLFTDEAHLLLVFFEYGDGHMTRGVTGVQARTVIDSEAGDILMDYLDRYYYEQNLTDEQYFSKAFSDAADRIMTVYRSPWIPVFITIGVAVLLLTGYAWWSKSQKQKDIKARRTEEILKTPLERFGSTEIDELAKKYEDKDLPPVAPPTPSGVPVAPKAPVASAPSEASKAPDAAKSKDPKAEDAPKSLDGSASRTSEDDTDDIGPVV